MPHQRWHYEGSGWLETSRSGIQPPSAALGWRGRSGTGELGGRSRSLSAWFARQSLSSGWAIFPAPRTWALRRLFITFDQDVACDLSINCPRAQMLTSPSACSRRAAVVLGSKLLSLDADLTSRKIRRQSASSTVGWFSSSRRGFKGSKTALAKTLDPVDDVYYYICDPVRFSSFLCARLRTTFWRAQPRIASVLRHRRGSTTFHQRTG